MKTTVAVIVLCFVVVKQQKSTGVNQTIDLHNLQVPPLKHSVLVETIANIFPTVVPFAKIMQIRLATVPIHQADLFDLDNMVKTLYQRKNFQLIDMDPQNIYRESLELQGHVIIVADTHEGLM